MRLLRISKDPDDYRGGGRWVGDDRPAWIEWLTRENPDPIPRSCYLSAWFGGGVVSGVVTWVLDRDVIVGLLPGAIVGATVAEIAWRLHRRRQRRAG